MAREENYEGLRGGGGESTLIEPTDFQVGLLCQKRFFLQRTKQTQP